MRASWWASTPEFCLTRGRQPVDTGRVHGRAVAEARSVMHHDPTSELMNERQASLLRVAFLAGAITDAEARPVACREARQSPQRDDCS